MELPNLFFNLHTVCATTKLLNLTHKGRVQAKPNTFPSWFDGYGTTKLGFTATSLGAVVYFSGMLGIFLFFSVPFSVLLNLQTKTPMYSPFQSCQGSY